MKWTAIILIAGLVQAQGRSIAQGTITINVKKAPLSKVFSKIQQQSGFAIWYDHTLLEHTRPVDLDLKEASLSAAMEACCRNQPIGFLITEKMVVIQAKSGAMPQEPLTIDVRGTIVNEKNEPIAGATIAVIGGNRSIVSDSQGVFELKSMQGTETLIITNVGYEAMEIPISYRQNIVVRMRISISRLDEIQVIAYGTTTKRLATGSVAKLSSGEIEKQPITNPLQAMVGRISGLQITQANGLPGAPIAVQIRGKNSIAASNNPLYVVDGVPFTPSPVEMIGGPNTGGTPVLGSPMNSISPSDIASIEVLKDADATAIYGSRGANGVILVTTKKGAAGKTKFDISANRGWGIVTRLAPTLNTSQYLRLRRDALTNSGQTPNAGNAPDLITWDTTAFTDWQKWFLGGTAQNTDASATVSGGNLQTNFLISGSWHDESTVRATRDRYTRSTVHMNNSHYSINRKFRINANAFYTTDRNKLGGIGMPLNLVAASVPDYPVYDGAGKLNWTGSQVNYLARANSYYKSNTNNLNGSLGLFWQPIQGLSLGATMGYNRIGITQVNVSPISSKNPATTPTGASTFGQRTEETTLFEPQANYLLQKGSSQFTLMAGSSLQRSVMEGSQLILGGYTNDLQLESLSFGNLIYKRALHTEYKYLSIFGRMGYQFRNKYLVNVNMRRDGSSRFGPGKKFGSFGSVGGAWIFSNEPWAKHFKALSFGKLRTSYGTTGNDGIPDYGYLSTYYSTSLYGNANAIIPAQVANPDYRWELNRKLSIALELGFFKDRILFTGEWYRNRTGDQLVGYALPSITGFSSYQANLPAMVQNQGWEFELEATVADSKKFKWELSANFTLPENKLVQFPGIETSVYSNSYAVGSPLSIISGYSFTGVDPATGVPGFLDVNKDGVLTPAFSLNHQGGDFVIIGKTAPAWFGGFNSRFQYSSFTFSVQLSYIRQTGYNLNRYESVAGRLGNSWSALYGYWRKAGDITEIPKPFAGYNDALNNYVQSSAILSDASFLRLVNLALDYRLPEKCIKKLKIGSATLFARGQNLFTITGYRGYDPETAVNPTPQIPLLKTITAGFTCSLQ